MQATQTVSADAGSIPSSVRQMLQGHSREEMERIVHYGKKQIDAMAEGRRKGQIAHKEQAEARRQFIIETARAEKKEYPYLTEAGIVAQVEQRLHERKSKFSFGKGRLPRPRTIHDILKEAGFFDSA